MKFKKLIRKLAAIKSDVPVKFYYLNLKGDYYLGSKGEFLFLGTGDRDYSHRTFTLEDFQRKDWEIMKR